MEDIIAHQALSTGERAVQNVGSRGYDTRQGDNSRGGGEVIAPNDVARPCRVAHVQAALCTYREDRPHSGYLQNRNVVLVGAAVVVQVPQTELLAE
jgi:hypothetical protein